MPDELRLRVKPLLPPDAAGTGRPRADDRAALAGVAYALRTGCAWNRLPAAELGVSGPTWRRRRDRTAAGVRPALHRAPVDGPGREGRLDASTVPVDSASVRARKGGAHAGPNPPDRGKAGCKRHVVTGRAGVPPVVLTTPANVRDDRPVPALPAAPARLPVGPRPCAPTGGTASRRRSCRCGRRGWRRGWPRAARRTAAGLAARGGRSSGRRRGSATTAGCGRATSGRA